MRRGISTLVVVGALIALFPMAGMATTREIADLQLARFSFDRSVLNQLSYETYRDPFDELQTRPYNLLFANIGRHSNLTPWEGQEGNYTRYFNGLIGNNGAANVDNDADAIQGALIRRETAALAWGVSAAMLSGTDGNDDTLGTLTFSDSDDLTGFELNGGAALQISERRVLGAGLRLTQANHDITSASFEPLVGGFFGAEEFAQTAVSLNFGMRQYPTERSSWETQIVVGFGSVEQDQFSESLDGAGIVTDLFVTTDYEISEMSVGLYGGYNRLRVESLGETEFRVGLERSQRELDNTNLAFFDNLGVVTPTATLLGQDTIASTRLHLSAKTIFQAGETEMFAGSQLGYGMVDGATEVDSLGFVVNERIDDTDLWLALTVGVRQPLMKDKLRFIVSGRADFLSEEQTTVFDSSIDGNDSTLSSAQYAIGLEGVLSNVTFDIAWLSGEEAPVVPVPLGLPAGSRRSVEVDRLVFSAAVSW